MNAHRRLKKPHVGDAAETAQESGAVEEGDPPLPPVQAICYDPNVKPGSVDVTGIVPDDVHVDPEILEGHAGYDESGASGALPGRLSRRTEG